MLSGTETIRLHNGFDLSAVSGVGTDMVCRDSECGLRDQAWDRRERGG